MFTVRMFRLNCFGGFYAFFNVLSKYIHTFAVFWKPVHYISMVGSIAEFIRFTMANDFIYTYLVFVA